jgi:hypothetical protein
MSKGGRSIFAALALAGVFALAGCGGDDTSSGTGTGLISGGSGGGGGAGGGGIPAATTPPPTLGNGCGQQGTDLICITVASAAASLPADGSSTSVITATLTRNGAAVSGQIVDFTLSITTAGTLTAANGVTSGAGTVTTIFQAGATIGAVGISAAHSASGAANTLALALTQPAASTPGGIQFISAIPGAVGVVGSGQPTTSSVTFRVTDPNGGPIPGQTVSFTMTGPVGSYIGPSDSTPTTATGTTNSAGNVSVPLNAGSAAGPVTIRADVTVGATTFTTATSVISIGGAVPSAHHFTIATSRFNLPGLVKAGFEATISVFLADRFSNFNILAGTQVSFFTEAGAVDTSVNLSDTGSGSVTIRTQNPMPTTVVSATPFNRNGHLKVIAVVRGEEGFFDVNGNGLYDPGIDTFTTGVNGMDQDEPFVDTNDNGLWDGPGCTQPGCITTHPGEQFVDSNGNGRWDAANGVWDGPGCTQAGCVQNPTIWQSIVLQFTGNLTCRILDLPGATFPHTSFALTNGGAGATRAYRIEVFDVNENAPVPGTSVSISVSGGIATGAGGFTVIDGVSSGKYFRDFTISDPDPNTATAATAASITITIAAPAGEVATCGNSPLVITGTTQ